MSLDERQRAGVVAPPSKLPLVLVAVVVLAAIGGIAWFLLGRQAAAPTGNSASSSADPSAGRGELLPSGLRIEMFRTGTAPLITRADAVLLRFEVRKPGGPVLSGNLEAQQGSGITLNQVAPGFAEGLSRMRPGDIARFWMTARHAYGPQLPANAPFGPDDMLEILVNIEQVAVGRASELEARAAQAGNSLESNVAIAANMTAPAPPAAGR